MSQRGGADEYRLDQLEQRVAALERAIGTIQPSASVLPSTPVLQQPASYVINNRTGDVPDNVIMKFLTDRIGSPPGKNINVTVIRKIDRIPEMSSATTKSIVLVITDKELPMPDMRYLKQQKYFPIHVKEGLENLIQYGQNFTALDITDLHKEWATW